jgi:hypothetical protein
MNPPFPDLRGEHRSEPVPPEPDRLVANVDAALEQQILDLAERQWLAHIHHHRQANDLGRRVEIAERIFHPPKLRGGPDSLKLFCSDNASERLCSGARSWSRQEEKKRTSVSYRNL